MSVNIDLNGELQTEKVNPFYIPEITEHMFQFLKLSEIKNCRLVCRKWNQLAEEFLKKLSAVNILKPGCVEEFNLAIPNALQSHRFTCFRIGHQSDRHVWPIYTFVGFCEKWLHALSELTLLRPNFGFDEEKDTFDLSPLLPSTLIKLQIKSFNPKLIISTDKICNIRILELEDCILNVIPDTTLNTVEIDLDDVTFYKNEKWIPGNFLINPLLNWDVLKKAKFRGGDMLLDLQGSCILDMLSWWTSAGIYNLEKSNWEIKKLCLGIYPCDRTLVVLSKSKIKYKELEINWPQLNVSLLLEDIEKLQVNLYYLDKMDSPRIYGEHNFPHLKTVHLTVPTGRNFSPFVESFKHCPQLSFLNVELTFRRYDSSGKSILKTSSVPPSVKTLRVMFGGRIIVDRSLELESLILNCPHHGGQEDYNNIVHIAVELHVKNLIWTWTGIDVKTSYSGHRNIFDTEKGNIIKSLIELKLDNFVVGDFSQVSNSEFEKSYLFPLVDTQGEYYLFQAGEKGKAISECDAEGYQKSKC